MQAEPTTAYAVKGDHMAVESEELRERLKAVSDELELVRGESERFRKECMELAGALRKVIGLLPDSQKDEIIRFLVTGEE